MHTVFIQCAILVLAFLFASIGLYLSTRYHYLVVAIPFVFSLALLVFHFYDMYVIHESLVPGYRIFVFCFTLFVYILKIGVNWNEDWVDDGISMGSIFTSTVLVTFVIAVLILPEVIVTGVLEHAQAIISGECI